MPPKRRREVGGGSGGGGGGGGEGGGGGGGGGRSTPPAPPPLPAPALKRRCRSFDLEIRGCRHLEELATSCVEKIEAAIRRIPGEVTKALTSFFSGVPGQRIEQNLPPAYKLRFVSSLSNEFFTKREVRADDEGLIKIAIAGSDQQGSIPPRLLSARIKIVVLDGDFNAENHEEWTPEEFSNHIVRPRDRVGVVLTGDLELKLKNGEAYLENATFTDNSKFTRSGKFRLGVQLIDDLHERVLEGITEPFIVKDRRGEGYKKRAIPRPDDEVWRLNKIAKNGTHHKALERSGIPTVKYFLRMYYKDSKALQDILNKPSQSVWKTIVDHAKMCHPGTDLYSHFMEDKKIRLYFSSLGQIVGATIAGRYNTFNEMNNNHSKAQVEEWIKDAYERIAYHQPDYEMYNNQPRLINCSALGGSIIPDQIIDEAAEQDTTSKGTGYSDGHSQLCAMKRLGSVRVRTLPSIQEDNETDPSFDIDVQLGSGPQVQYETPDANYNAGSVTLHCPTNSADQVVASVALDQAALTVHPGDYQMPFANDGYSVGQWYPDPDVVSQYLSPFPLSMQADHPVLSTQNSFSMDQLFENLQEIDSAPSCALMESELPVDVGSGMTKLPSCQRWVKLSVLMKWKAIVRASKRARLLEQEGWCS